MSNKRIKLSQGEYTIIDTKNFEWLNQWKWFAVWMPSNQSYYVMRNSRCVKGKRFTISMSREILGLVKGDKRQADHINHNTLDNRESNLRIVTCQQNQFNRKNSKGYYWNKRDKKYMAQIKVDGKIMNLGYFDKSEEAHTAYLKAKRKYHAD